MAYDFDEVLPELAPIIAEELEIDVTAINASQTLKGDLDVDSLSRLSIITAAEDHFKVDIPDDAAAGFETVGDLVNFVYGAQKAVS